MATTETRRRRGYKLVPMRQWSQWIDIVERLRVRPLLANDDPDIAEWRKRMEEAADEIEQLRENTFLKKGNVGVCEAIDDASEEKITAEVQELLNAGVMVSFGAPSTLNTDMFQQEGEGTGMAPSPVLESLHPAVGTNSSAIKAEGRPALGGVHQATFRQESPQPVQSKTRAALQGSEKGFQGRKEPLAPSSNHEAMARERGFSLGQLNLAGKTSRKGIKLGPRKPKKSSA